MRNSMDSGFNEIKELKGRRGIRDGSADVNFMRNRLKLNKNEDRSNSEPPRSIGTYFPSALARLKPIHEKKSREDAQGSSDEDGELSNSQLNESDFDLEIPDSASASVSQTPTPTPLVSSNARRINSETNLNDSKRRLSGFMGNRSKRFCASTSELSFTSHLDTHKSLFSPKNNALSRQSFNSSLYGSNMSLSSTNSRLFMVNSPFYSGKTMFGGASAYPKRDINQHKILRNPVQMRPSSSLSNSSNTSAKSDGIMPESNAAKRILEIMNQFSGTLKETRIMGNNINSIIKIPSLVQSRKRYGEDDLHLDRSIALSTPTAPYGRPLPGAPTRNRPESPLSNSSITKPLQIPTMSQLLQMKRLQNNTERVREIASRSDSFLNKNHEYKLPSTVDEVYSNSTGASSLKMKSNISKNLLRPDKNSINDQLPALPVNLPNIQLPQLKSIPKFDILLPASSVSSGPTKTQSPPKPITSSVVKVPEVQFNFQNKPASNFMEQQIVAVKKNNNYNFARPLPAGDGSVDFSTLNRINEKYIFSKPILISDEDEELLAKTPTKSTLSTLATDNLFKNLVAQQKSSTWECDSCFTGNKSEVASCLCCNASKPGSEVVSPQSSSFASNTSAPKSDELFKNLAAQQKKSQWECDDCMTRNDSCKDKCGCCEKARPGSKAVQAALAPAATFTFGMPASSQSAPKSDDLFKNLAAQQKKSQWECDDCLSQNDPSKDKCACCDKLKPGAVKSNNFGMQNNSSAAAATPAFSFGMPQATSTFTSDAGFKKLVDKQKECWACSTCMTQNESSKTKCVCCEQEKPGSTPAAPQFSFGSKLTSSVSLPAPSEVKFSFGMTAAKVDVPVIENKKDEQLKDEVDKPKPTFTFGGNNNNGINSLGTSKQLTTESSAIIAPSFSFKSPANATSVSASFTMNAPEKVEEKKEELATIESKATEMFKFGAPAKPTLEAEKKITFGNPTTTTEPVITKEPEKKEEATKSDFGGFNFGETPVTQAPSFGSSINSNGGFSFGGFGVTKPAEPVKQVETVKAASTTLPAAGFSFGAANASPKFGSQTATTAPTTNFFGASKTENEAPKTFGSFSGASTGISSTPVPSFGMPAIQSAPVFGQSNAASGGFSFSAKKEESAPVQQSSPFAFGAPKQETQTNSTMLFGGNQMSQAQNATPMFGAGSTPTPTFGSNNNNESGFGSKMPSPFGNSAHPQKRAFEISSATSEVPQAKKFEFGAQQQQQQHQASATPFQFNAQGNENRPAAFNFNSSAAPSFSFTATNNSQDQQNLFQFGANNSNSNQGIFSFTPSSAPVMQFGSGGAAPMVPGINAFTAQGTGSSSAAANNRRILRAARRTTTRR